MEKVETYRGYDIVFETKTLSSGRRHSGYSCKYVSNGYSSNINAVKSDIDEHWKAGYIGLYKTDRMIGADEGSRPVGEVSVLKSLHLIDTFKASIGINKKAGRTSSYDICNVRVSRSYHQLGVF